MTTRTLERPVPVEGPEESAPAQTVRLSAALRRGACMHPQGRGSFYHKGKTCALGAILVGLMGPEYYVEQTARKSPMHSIVRRQTGVDLHQTIRVPYGEGGCTLPSSLWGAIMYLNDTAGWTREQIATWLEGKGL